MLISQHPAAPTQSHSCVARPPERYPGVIEAADALSAREEPDSFYELVIGLIRSGESAAAQTAAATCWQ